MPARRAQNTRPSSLHRMIPTLRRYPSESIMSGASPVAILKCY